MDQVGDIYGMLVSNIEGLTSDTSVAVNFKANEMVIMGTE